MSDDLFSKHKAETKQLHQDHKTARKELEAANGRFRESLESARRDAEIERGQRKEREDRSEYRSGLITEITRFKSDIARDIDACPFPPVSSYTLSSTSSVKERLQREFGAIDPYTADGQTRLKQLLARVQAHRAEATPLLASSYGFGMTPKGPSYEEKQRLTEALTSLEKDLEYLIMYARWWQESS